MTKCTTLVTVQYHYPFLTHFYMKLQNLKETKNKIFNRFYRKENINLSKWKNMPWKKTLGFHFIGAFYSKNPHFDSLKRSVENNQNINFSQTTRSYILNSFWQLVKTFNIMELFPIIYCWSVKQAVEKQVLYKVQVKTKYLVAC